PPRALRPFPASSLVASSRNRPDATTNVRPVELGAMLLSGLEQPDGREAIRVGEDALTYERLHAAAGGGAERGAGATPRAGGGGGRAGGGSARWPPGSRSSRSTPSPASASARTSCPTARRIRSWTTSI